MKIAIDIRTAAGEKAGKGWYTFFISQNLLKLDKKNSYILYTKDKVAGFEQFKNARIKPIKGRGYFWHRKVAKDIKKEKVDLFFAPSSCIIPALLPENIKTIITVHDLVAFLFPNTHDKKAVLIEKLFLKKALKKATRVLAVSNNTKRDIIQKFKCDSEKISVIYCSASDNFKPVEKESLIDFAKKTNLPKKFFLAVGAIIQRKNYKNLLLAFARIHEKYPAYHLIIVGGKGWREEEIHDLIREKYLQKFVHFLGYLSETSLVNLYNLAYALVFPSLYEGFGIPPLEAMKCGCPVIASYTSSIPEVAGDSALLINPAKPEKIAEAMEKLIKNPRLCEKLRVLGFEQSKKFSWEKSAGKIVEIINS